MLCAIWIFGTLLFSLHSFKKNGSSIDMAMIQIIRNKLGPFIVIIIGLSLGLFVLQTAFDSKTNLLGGKGNDVGSIDGTKIDVREFQAKVDTSIEAYKLNSNNKNVDEATIFSIREQTWNQMIGDYLNKREFAALGITLPKDQIQDLFFGADPYPELKKSVEKFGKTK